MTFIERVQIALGLKAVPPPVEGRALPYYGILAGMGGDISARQAWTLYKSVGSFAKVVDLIADSVAGLQPVVKEGGEILDDHEAELFLMQPGFNRTRRQLIKEVAVQLLVTGTSYVHALGNVGRMPFALDSFKSHETTTIEGVDGWPDKIIVTEPRRSFTFDRENTKGTDYRWLDGFLGEVIPVYDLSGDCKGVGLSRLQAVRADVELKLKGLQHNRSLIDKGARLSGILSFKNSLTAEQRSDIRQQFSSQATGAANAGGVFVTGGGEADFNSLMISPKDMDWHTLMKIVDDAIIARFNVPVTLFAIEAQTHNNYETAWRAFYDNAVLPVFSCIYDAIGQNLSRRLGRPIEIVHDELTNNVLARQAVENARELLDGQMITKNEARELVGYEPLAGGDDILDLPGLVPQFSDVFPPVPGLDLGNGTAANGTQPAANSNGKAPAGAALN